MKKIGLVSDLHLEGSNIKLENPGWDYLVIAGDLSAYRKDLPHFFSYNAPQDIPIIYVLGNHEYEGQRLHNNVDNIKELLQPFENVHVLSNESIIIDNTKFIGSTLWSNFELDGLTQKEEAMKWAKYNIVDFSYIFDRDENDKYMPLNPKKMEQLNKEAYEFIKYELTKNPFDGSKVVVTHFAPHRNSVHAKYANRVNSYWVNHFEELMGFSDYWFHGHTHNSFDYTVEGTRVVCNPRGYSKVYNMSQNEQFNKELILPIEYSNEMKEDSTMNNTKNLSMLKKKV